MLVVKELLSMVVILVLPLTMDMAQRKLQAVQEAQLIMYELARKDLMDAFTESEK